MLTLAASVDISCHLSEAFCSTSQRYLNSTVDGERHSGVERLTTRDAGYPPRGPVSGRTSASYLTTPKEVTMTASNSAASSVPTPKAEPLSKAERALGQPVFRLDLRTVRQPRSTIPSSSHIHPNHTGAPILGTDSISCTQTLAHSNDGALRVLHRGKSNRSNDQKNQQRER